ncbi:MAG: cellulase family glycosylhydrolase [Chloroflexota bacterium]
MAASPRTRHPRRSVSALVVAGVVAALLLALAGGVAAKPPRHRTPSPSPTPAPVTVTASAGPSAVPADRLARLARGVSITRWFWNPEGIAWAPDHAATYVSDDRLRAIRAAGFGHVRLPIEPKDLVDAAHPGRLDPALLADLDAAIARMTAADLAVLVDPHGWEDDWQEALRTDPATQDAFVAMWSSLAAHLAATTDPSLVYLEVLNEPSFATAEWQPILDRAVEAIRAVAPQHTIIVGPGLWNGIDGLEGFTPPADANLVVNVHDYDPFLFTHQTAAWAGTMGYVQGIPYPNDRYNGCDYLPKFGHDLDGWVEGYCTTEHWNADAVDARIAVAADWAAAHGNVPLTVNEFGVMPTAPYRDRLDWIRDTRAAVERHGAGWTIWGWDDGFGLDAVAQGTMDVGVLGALGMDVGAAIAAGD